MQPGNQPPAAPPSNLNFPAIHAAYAQHMQNPGNAMQPGQQPQAQIGGTPAQGPQQPPMPQPQGQPGGGVPQPQQNSPAYATLIQAMAQMPKVSGEDPEMAILKSFGDHLKRIRPDVSGIHKQQDQKPNTGGGAY